MPTVIDCNKQWSAKFSMIYANNNLTNVQNSKTRSIQQLIIQPNFTGLQRSYHPCPSTEDQVLMTLMNGTDVWTTNLCNNVLTVQLEGSPWKAKLFLDHAVRDSNLISYSVT